MTLHLHLHVYCHSRSLGLFWLLSSGHWALWVPRSQFWTLDFASGFAQTQVECTFCVKVCEFHVCSLCMCVCECVLVLCFAVFVCCFVAHSLDTQSVSRTDGQSEAQLLKKPNSWHADHINLSSLCKISCMIWPLPAPAPGLALARPALLSVSHCDPSCPYVWNVYECVWVFVVEWTRCDAWNV